MEQYSGRLAFDPDSGFHTEVILGEPYDGEIKFDRDSQTFVTDDGRPVATSDGGESWRIPDTPGRRVVTDDEGKTWRYAEEGDASHQERYQLRVATVDTTDNELARLTLEHGPERAAVLVDPHHYEVQPGDPHFDGVRSDPDVDAPTMMSHTDAWKEA
jgi:hypothetical protein